jgi:hypothetical protein
MRQSFSCKQKATQSHLCFACSCETKHPVEKLFQRLYHIIHGFTITSAQGQNSHA